MTNHVRRAVPVVALVVACLGGLGAQVAGATTPSVVEVRTSAAVTLADAGGTDTSVVSATLPAGSWTIDADVTAINFGQGDYVRCHLVAGRSAIDGGATVYLENRVAGLTNVGAAKSSSPFTVTLLCDHDTAAASSGQFYIDPGATLIATKGGPISAPGITPSGTPTVVQSRSTGSTALDENTYTPLASVHLPAGTWALTGDGSAVDFSGTDSADCDVTATGKATADSSFNQAWVGSSDAYVTGLDVEGAVVVPSGGSTVSFACAAEFASGDITVDPGATLTATKVKSAALTNASIGEVALPDAGSTTKAVATEKMPAGAWRVRSVAAVGNRNSNNSFGGGRDFLRCTLLANGKAIDGGATVEMTPNVAWEQIVNTGTYTASTSWTLKLSCSHDAAHTGDGHWSTLGAGAMVAIDKGPIS